MEGTTRDIDAEFEGVRDVTTEVLYQGISVHLDGAQIHSLVERMLLDLTPNQRRSLMRRLIALEGVRS